MNTKINLSNSIQRMILNEIYRLKLINPNLMDMTAESIIFLAVNALRMEEEEKVKKGLVTWQH